MTHLGLGLDLSTERTQMGTSRRDDARDVMNQADCTD